MKKNTFTTYAIYTGEYYINEVLTIKECADVTGLSLRMCKALLSGERHSKWSITKMEVDIVEYIEVMESRLLYTEELTSKQEDMYFRRLDKAMEILDKA